MSINATNPGTFIGGTWEQIKDRFLLGAGTTYAAGSTGGEATHTLTAQEMPKHMHDLIALGGHVVTAWGSTDDKTPSFALGDISKNNGGSVNKLTTKYEGGDQPHNNMPPYLAVYMWVRTA